MARQTAAQLVDRIEDLESDLSRERRRRRYYEGLAEEFERDAVTAMDDRDEALADLDEAQREAADLAGLYTHAVASLVSLVSDIGARLRAMADGGEAGPDDLCGLADALADMPEGQLIALGSKTLAAMPGRDEPPRCIDCRGYGYARFAHSACLFGAFRDGEPYAFNLACDRFEPWPAGPASLALGPRGASTGHGGRVAAPAGPCRPGRPQGGTPSPSRLGPPGGIGPIPPRDV